MAWILRMGKFMEKQLNPDCRFINRVEDGAKERRAIQWSGFGLFCVARVIFQAWSNLKLGLSKAEASTKLGFCFFYSCCTQTAANNLLFTLGA